MIASKKIYCNAHKYRQEIMSKYKNSIDCYGQGHNPIVKKEEGLKDKFMNYIKSN
jgi:hypothetical protein